MTSSRISWANTSTWARANPRGNPGAALREHSFSVHEARESGAVTGGASPGRGIVGGLELHNPNRSARSGMARPSSRATRGRVTPNRSTWPCSSTATTDGPSTSTKVTVTGALSEAYQAALLFYNNVKTAKKVNAGASASVFDDLSARFPGATAKKTSSAG